MCYPSSMIALALVYHPCKIFLELKVATMTSLIAETVSGNSFRLPYVSVYVLRHSRSV